MSSPSWETMRRLRRSVCPLDSSNLPALPPTDAKPNPPRPPLVPERSDFFEGDAPVADKVEAFLANALEASGSASVAAALVPWICDSLLSNHSVKAYGRDFMDFVRRMQAQGVTPLAHVWGEAARAGRRRA